MLADTPCRYVRGHERGRPNETLEHEAQLSEAHDVDQKVKKPVVHEHRRRETPPFAVCRARPECATPGDERLRIIHSAGTSRHHHEDGDIHHNQHWRGERPGRPFGQGARECLEPRIPEHDVLHLRDGSYRRPDHSHALLLGHEVGGDAQRLRERPEETRPSVVSITQDPYRMSRGDSGQIPNRSRQAGSERLQD